MKDQDERTAGPAAIRPPRPVSLAYLDRAALAYLERYASSSENLRRVLTRKIEKRCRLRGEDPAPFLPLVDEVVRRAIGGGYLDDQRYAEGRVAALRRRGGSTRGIAAKLRAKGVDPSAIGAALASHETDDAGAAWAFARRRRLVPYRTAERAERRGKDAREKDLAALMRAGFSYGLAKAVVDGDPE